MSAVIEASGLGKRYRRAWRCASARSQSPRPRHRARRPQRRGQDHLAAAGYRAAGADLRNDQRPRLAPGRRWRSWPGSASSPRTHPLRPDDGRRISASAPGSTPAGTTTWRGGGSGSSAWTRSSAPGRCPAAARPARPHPGAGQAARAAHPRRAGRQPRPTRPARVPPSPDGGVAEHGLSVVLSSHLVADLERVCDYLIVLVASRVRIAGEVSDLLASHHRLPVRAATTGTRRQPANDHRKPHRQAD